MRIVLKRKQANSARSGFSIIEMMVAGGILGIMFLSLYGGISSGFAVINLARENLRATQILLEKTEAMRLYNWSQINSNGFIPLTFTDAFYPMGGTNSGLLYQGQVTITNAPITAPYSNDLRMVTIRVTWVSGKITRQREMSTFVARNGLQQYIY